MRLVPTSLLGGIVNLPRSEPALLEWLRAPAGLRDRQRPSDLKRDESVNPDCRRPRWNSGLDNRGRPETSDRLYITQTFQAPPNLLSAIVGRLSVETESVVRTHSVSLHEAGRGGEAAIKCMNNAWAVYTVNKPRPTYALQYSDE